MALGAGLVGLLLRCWCRAAAHLGGADLKAGVLGSLFYEHSILLLAGVGLVPAVLGMDRGVTARRVAVSPVPEREMGSLCGRGTGQCLF